MQGLPPHKEEGDKHSLSPEEILVAAMVTIGCSSICFCATAPLGSLGLGWHLTQVSCVRFSEPYHLQKPSVLTKETGD